MSADAAFFPARPDRLIMATVFACALAAGWAMLPGENERVAMLERDGHSREALAILEQRFDAGDRRYRTLHQILALYENEGNVTKARLVLEAMAAERPRDPILKRRLVQFYKNNQHDAEYIAALQDLIELRYSESACKELIGRLRFDGDLNAEQSAIQRCRQKGYRRPEDLSRLAEFVAADGDNAQATGILKSIDDLKRLKTQRERFQLLSLLAEQDQPNEAERRALRWIRSSHDDAGAVSFIDHLARSKYPDLAYEVAKDTGIPGDGISLTVAERLIEKNQNGAALLYLRGWLDRAKTVDAETAIRFTDSAVAVGDPRLAVQGARQFGYILLPPQNLQKIVAALDQINAVSEAAEVRKAIAGGAPELPSDTSKPASAGGAGAALGDVAAAAATNDGSRVRSVLLVDPLDAWRRSLFTTMTTDAQRRMQALFVGPNPLPLHAGRHFERRGRNHDFRIEHRSGGAKLLNKTSRVLQRTKKLSALRAKRHAAELKNDNGLQTPQETQNTPGKSKSGGAQKP